MLVFMNCEICDELCYEILQEYKRTLSYNKSHAKGKVMFFSAASAKGKL